jgi:hypothetical protein
MERRRQGGTSKESTNQTLISRLRYTDTRIVDTGLIGLLRVAAYSSTDATVSQFKRSIALSEPKQVVHISVSVKASNSLFPSI